MFRFLPFFLILFVGTAASGQLKLYDSFGERISDITAMACFPDGDILLAGDSYEGSYLFRVTSGDSIVWAHLLDDSHRPTVADLKISSDSSIYALVEQSVYNHEHRVTLAKFDFGGQQLWNCNYDLGPHFYTYGRLYLLVANPARIYTHASTREYSIVTQYDSSGTIVWSKKISIDTISQWNNTHWGTGLLRTHDGGVVSLAKDGDDAIMLTKIAANGQKLWSKRYDDWTFRWPHAFTYARDSGFYIGGSAAGWPFIMKVDKDGIVEWYKRDGQSYFDVQTILTVGDTLVLIDEDAEVVRMLDVDGNNIAGRAVNSKAYRCELGPACETPDGSFRMAGYCAHNEGLSLVHSGFTLAPDSLLSFCDGTGFESTFQTHAFNPNVNTGVIFVDMLHRLSQTSGLLELNTAPISVDSMCQWPIDPEDFPLAQSIALYPIPNEGWDITLSLSNGYSISEIEIFDSMGRHIYSETPGEVKSHEVHFGTELRNGVYLMRIRSGHWLAVKRFVVK